MSKREAYERASRWLTDVGFYYVDREIVETIRAHVTDLEQQIADAHEALAMSAEMRADVLEATAREAWDAARTWERLDIGGGDFLEGRHYQWHDFETWWRNRGGK